MSMPQSFTIAVVSGNKATSSAVTSLLRWTSSMSPDVLAAYNFNGINSKGFNKQLIQAGLERNLLIPESIYIDYLDPKKIDLWLALDEMSEKYAQDRIRKVGSPPKRFYQFIFPSPVIYCGFDVPALKGIAYQSWFDNLETLFKPWKERLWQAFCDSS
jgi:hypothetical protein